MSPAAQEIALNRPRFWEHLLYAELLSDELPEIRLALQDEALIRERINSKYYGYLENDPSGALIEIVNLAKSQLLYIGEIATSFRKFFPDENQDAFGPIGTPGDPRKINIVAKKYASEYFDIGCHWIEVKALFHVIDLYAAQIGANDPRKSFFLTIGNECLKSISAHKNLMLEMDGFGSYLNESVNAARAEVKKTRKFVLSWPDVDIDSEREEARIENAKYEFDENNISSSVDSKNTNASFNSITDIYTWIASCESISKADLRRNLLPLGLLVSAVVEEVNEKALGVSGDFAMLEEGDKFEVNRDIMMLIINNIEKFEI
nr:tellurite resistance TerB C-terminal domain-containing protein [uncultured Limnohabitans sp.]